MKNKQIYWHNEEYRFRFHDGTYTCPLHIHQHIEFVFVIEGKIQLTISNTSYTLSKNDAAIIFPWQPHEYINQNNHKVFICVFSEKLLPEFYQLIQNFTVKNSMYTSSSVTSYLISTLSRTNNISIYNVKAFLYNAIDDFLSNAELAVKNNKLKICNKIIEYITNNINEDLNLEKMAEDLGYSRNYLSHIIKKQIGVNFKTILNCIRIENAKSLLINTDYTISEITYLCGFGTERSLNRAFSYLLGITPTEYRKRKF